MCRFTTVAKIRGALCRCRAPCSARATLGAIFEKIWICSCAPHLVGLANHRGTMTGWGVWGECNSCGSGIAGTEAAPSGQSILFLGCSNMSNAPTSLYCQKLSQSESVPGLVIQQNFFHIQPMPPTHRFSPLSTAL